MRFPRCSLSLLALWAVVSSGLWALSVRFPPHLASVQLVQPSTLLAQINLPLLGIGGATSSGGTAKTFQKACHYMNNGSTNSNLSCTTATSGNISAHDEVIVFAQSGASSAPTYTSGMASDGCSDSFTLLRQANDTTNTQYGGMWYAQNSAGGCALSTIQVAFSSCSSCDGYSTIVAFEISGNLTSGSADAGNSNVSTCSGSTNGCTSGSFSTTQTNDFIVACFMNDTTTNTFTAGTSPLTFTIPTNGQQSSIPTACEYATESSITSLNPAITTSSTNGYIAIGEGFK